MPRVRGVGAPFLVLVLVVVDIILIGAAFRHTNGEGQDQQAVSAPLPSDTASASSSPSPSAGTAAPTKPAKLLSNASTEVAWRANFGCGGHADLERTTNGGRSWKKLPAPAPHILRVVMTGPTAGWVVGTDVNCQPSYYTTTNNGAAWAKAPTLGQVWVALPTGVRRPNGKTSKPCGAKSPVPVSLAPVSETVALALCADGVGVVRTSNGGKSWKPGELTEGSPVALTMSGSLGVELVGDVRDCGGLLALYTTNTGQTWTGGACLDGKSTTAYVSLNASGQGLALGLRNLYKTRNGGASWH